MSEIQTVLYDLGYLSFLLLLGVFLRKKVKFLQNIYIPASLLGGFCGLILGPQILGSVCFKPIKNNSYTLSITSGGVSKIVWRSACVSAKADKRWWRGELHV